MRFPKPLPQNGIIEFVAPSFGCATEPYKTAFDSALSKWQKAGYTTFLGPNCYACDGIGISSTPISCASELMSAYGNTKSDAIISCGGGELMCETISQIDFDAINRAEPKWYMGYSDNTNFTFLLNTLCDTASVYGPCASSFGAVPTHQSHEDAMMLISSSEESIHLHGYDKWEKEGIKDAEHPLAGYNLDQNSFVRSYIGDGEKLYKHQFGNEIADGDKAASANTASDNAAIDNAGYARNIHMEGRLIGGCLDCLVNLCGTKFDKVKEFNKKYAKDGIIWFVESCDLGVMSMRRAMWELEEAGWFENASGFIIGRPLMFDENFMGLDHYSAFYDVISHYKVPIIMDADLGHLPPMVPVISGSYAKVNAGNGKWDIEMFKR